MIPVARAASRRARGGPQIGPYRVDGNRIEHPDGDVSLVLATGELDVLALDATRQRAVLSSFARLCHTLDAPLQLLVRIRPVQAEDAQEQNDPGAHAELDRAMAEHWAARLRSTTPHMRQVLIATRTHGDAALDRTAAHLTELLRGFGVGAQRLHGEALAAAISGDAGTPACAWRAEPQHALVGEVYVRCYAMRRLPGHPVSAGWLGPLLTVSTDCDIAIHLVPAALADALHTLGRRLRTFAAHRMLEVERGSLSDVHVDIALDSAFALRGRLARNIGRPLHVSIVAAVRAPSPEELHRRSETVRLAFRAALAGVEPAHFRHLSGYVAALPLARDLLGAAKLVDSRAAATCIPWVEAGCADPDGYRIGAAARTGAPVRLAPFDTARHSNANIAVFAASGHGKSFALGTLVLEAAARGVASVIIDPEGEYDRIVAALGGNCLALAPGTGAAVNVFDAQGDATDDAVAAVTDLVGVMCGGGLSDVHRAQVDAAARAAQQRAAAAGRVALLADMLPLLEHNARDVAVVLRRFCSGGLGALFNRPTSLRIDAPVCAISLRDMPSEHVAAATMIVARWLWTLVRRDRHRRHIVFDEVGALCAHAPLRSLLVQLARRCRKYGASLVVATQNAQDLLASDEGSVVATNCSIVLLGGHRPAETERMAAAFGLTGAQRSFVETAARGEFLLLAGDRRVELRVDVPEMHRSILASGAPGT